MSVKLTPALWLADVSWDSLDAAGATLLNIDLHCFTPSGGTTLPDGGAGLTVDEAEKQEIVETFLQEIQGVHPADLEVSRLGVRLTAEDHEEYLALLKRAAQVKAR